MSDIILTAIAQDYADKKFEEFVTKIKDPELTLEGRKRVVAEMVFFAVLFGANIEKQRNFKKVEPPEFTPEELETPKEQK